MCAEDFVRDRSLLGIYLHFPFCASRCSYCDFATSVGRDADADRYLRGLREEIRHVAADLPRPVDTVYVGGGTPSRMTPVQVGSLLLHLRSCFETTSDCEITMEGNPETLTPEWLMGARAAGVTRLSVGVQSFSDEVLHRAGRPHGVEEAHRAVEAALAAGFDSVAVDLIAGLPGEDLAGWDETLRRAAELGPDHLSVYLLETDKESALVSSLREGLLEVADDDRLSETYELTLETLTSLGFEHYEISSFAREGKRSRHNLKYWTDQPFLGFGVGAHGYVRGERRANGKDLDRYLEAVLSGRDPAEWRDPFDPTRRLGEALMLGLRLTEGVNLTSLERRYGEDPRYRFYDAWERADAAGLVAWNGERVRLTASGRLRSNELFQYFV